MPPECDRGEHVAEEERRYPSTNPCGAGPCYTEPLVKKQIRENIRSGEMHEATCPVCGKVFLTNIEGTQVPCFEHQGQIQ